MPVRTPLLTQEMSAGSGTGLLANRPAANAVRNGYIFVASDDNGGTSYRSDGVSAWTKLAPGVSEGSGIELGYAEITSNFGPTAGGANTIYAITGLSTTVTVGSRPVRIEAFLPDAIPSVANATVTLLIYEDGSFVESNAVAGSATASKRTNPHTIVRRNPAAGSHTYDARIKSDIAATITVEAGVGFPAWIQVVAD
jgi:hypothetical protein